MSILRLTFNLIKPRPIVQVYHWLLMVAVGLSMNLQLRGQSAPVSSYIDEENGLAESDLIAMALRSNENLLALRQRIYESLGLLRQAGLKPNPGLNIVYRSGRPFATRNEESFSLGYSHIFELGGKRERRVEVAELQLEYTKLLIANQERLLRAEVRRAYGESLATIRDLEFFERLVQLNDETLNLVRAQYEVGETSLLNQRLLEVELGRLRADRIMLQARLEKTILRLKTLIGADAYQQLKLRGTLKLEPQKVPSFENLLQLAYEFRPDYRAALLAEQLAEATVRLRKSEAIPNLIASIGLSRSRSSFDALGLTRARQLTPLLDTDTVLEAGITIDLAIRNRNQGNIAAARAQLEAARHRLQYLRQVVKQEVLSAYRTYLSARRALTTYSEDVVRQSEDNLNVVRTAYRLGELRLLDVLNEQRRVIDMQRAYTQVLRDYYLAIVDLEQAVGTPLFGQAPAKVSKEKRDVSP